MEEKLTMAPPPRAISAGMAAWLTNTAVLTLAASSSSACSGLSWRKSPKENRPPATLTTTSSPPNCRVATATAARAASGRVRSPAAAWAVIPWAASSRTRSPSISALRSASTSFAPARPSPWATAWPIWPTRPTPVTSATLPRKSGTNAVSPSPRHRGDDLGRRRRAPLCELDRPVRADDIHRSLNALPVFLQGVIRLRDRTVGVGEQREVEVHLRHVAGVAPHRRGADAEALNARLPEPLDLIAHGGELAVSAGGIVAGLENQRDVRSLGHVAARLALPIR